MLPSLFLSPTRCLHERLSSTTFIAAVISACAPRSSPSWKRKLSEVSFRPATKACVLCVTKTTYWQPFQGKHRHKNRDSESRKKGRKEGYSRASASVCGASLLSCSGSAIYLPSLCRREGANPMKGLITSNSCEPFLNWAIRFFLTQCGFLFFLSPLNPPPGCFVCYLQENWGWKSVTIWTGNEILKNS